MSESKDKTEELTEREKEMAEELAEKTQAVENLTSEIKEVRSQKQEAEKKFEEALTQKPKEEEEEPGSDSRRVVEEVLAEKEKEQVALAKDEAIAEVRRKYKEFSEANDESGIAFSKFKKEAAKFNFEGLRTKEQILARYSEVYEFMNRGGSQPEATQNHHTGTPSSVGGEPKSTDAGTLSAAEAKLIKEKGWTKERFLEQKAKRPHYINTLLKWTN